MKLDRKKVLNVLYRVCVFLANRKIKMAVLSDLSIKEAHCTQTHNMWPFGPLVSYSQFCMCIYIFQYLICHSEGTDLNGENWYMTNNNQFTVLYCWKFSESKILMFVVKFHVGTKPQPNILYHRFIKYMNTLYVSKLNWA